MYNTGLTISCGTGLKIESVLTAGEIADRDATAVDVANQESVVHFGEILAGYARGSIFRGGAAYWEVHDAKTNHFILVGDGTDIVSKAFDWDDMAAGVAADMVHDHSSAAEGGATLGLTAITGAGVDVPDGWYLGIGAALERIVFDTAGDISVMGANLGVGLLDPDFTLTLGVNMTNAFTPTPELSTIGAVIRGVGTAQGDLYLHRDDATIVDTNNLGAIRFTGADGGYQVGAMILGRASDTWGAGDTPTELWFYTSPDAGVLAHNATLDGDGDFEAQSFSTGTTGNIDDDDFMSFTPTKPAGVIAIFRGHASYKNAAALIVYRTTAADCTAIIAQPAALVEVTTGALNGVTGNDGVVTVSAHDVDGKLYIENRLGATTYWKYVFLY